MGGVILCPALLMHTPSMREIHATVRCRGHPNVTGRHPTTFEVTREEHLSNTGDCIIGIAADRGASALPSGFAELLARDEALLVTRLCCGDCCVIITSQGSPAMTLDHPTDLVWRRSDYVCGRTVGIRSDMTARDLPRQLIALLQGGAELVVEMTVRVE
jgi:hypothetical protein